MKNKDKRRPFYKKLLILCICAAIAIFCMPGLWEKACTFVDFIKEERRKCL